ncbi:MAG TPA: hypothetical protein VER11_34235 [Polyangiaceae bacterium]|nr:hypothetical protein [Polyangiaceae bacterium]
MNSAALPPALLPAAANDARPFRAVYQTHDGARSAAQRAARAESPVNLCERVIDLGGIEVWAAIDGDARFIVELDTIGGDMIARPISLTEVARRQQAHLRSEAAGYLEEAARCTAEALKRPETSAVRRELLRRAVEMRDWARRTELKVILGTVIDCELTSSERDSRAEASR